MNDKRKCGDNHCYCHNIQEIRMSPHFFLTDNDEYHTLWNTGRYSRADCRTYDLELIHSIEEIGTCGALLPVPKITAPRQLLALYNALMRHEDAIDAVIICGSETCGAAGTICYGAPPGKIFTLCGDPGGEELEAELFRLLDAIFTQANRINL